MRVGKGTREVGPVKEEKGMCVGYYKAHEGR